MKEDLDVRWSKIWNGERILEHCVTLHSKDTNDWQKIFHMWNMWKGIHSSFKPAQAYRHHHGEKPLIGPNLCNCGSSFNWKDSRWCTPGGAIKKFFKCVLMLFPLSSMNTLFTWTFLLCWVTLWASLRCGKAYVSSRLWVWWNVCHNFFNVCIGKAFTSVSFYVHLQVVSTKRRFYAYFTCRKPFSSKQWPCGPSNSSDIRKLLHNICICQHFLQK